MALADMRDKLRNYSETMRNILNRAETEHRNLTDAETKDFDGLKAKAEALNATLNRAAQLGEMRSELEKPITAGPVVHNQPGELRYVPRSGRADEVRIYQPAEAISERPYSGPGIGCLVRGLACGKWNGAEELRSAMAEGAGASGGYLVPDILSAQVIDLARNQAAVIRAGAVTVPMTESTLKMARQASDVASEWKAENATFTYGDVTFEAAISRRAP